MSDPALRSPSPPADPAPVGLDRLEDRVGRILQRVAGMERVQARTGLAQVADIDEILGLAAGIEHEVAGLLASLDVETVLAAWPEITRIRARIAYACRRVHRLVRLLEADAVLAG